jgi:predicted amidophosphoribosyltransferase
VKIAWIRLKVLQKKVWDLRAGARVDDRGGGRAARLPGARATDVIVPVPRHRDRERPRGYNQASLISKALARKLGLPHKAVLLMRMRPRPDKRVLSLEERWESVRGAFATRPGSQVDNKRVLLVDDM